MFLYILTFLPPTEEGGSIGEEEGEGGDEGDEECDSPIDTMSQDDCKDEDEDSDGREESDDDDEYETMTMNDNEGANYDDKVDYGEEMDALNKLKSKWTGQEKSGERREKT